MFTIDEIWDDAKRITGVCDETSLLRWLTRGIHILANKGDWDPEIGYADICADRKCITMPRDVMTVLAVNIGGKPTLAHDQLFAFHLNGIGDCRIPCDWSWKDGAEWPTHRELKKPSKLAAFVENPADEDKELWVYGYDSTGKWIRSTDDGGLPVDGYRVPLFSRYALPAQTDPVVGRITRVSKQVTIDRVRLTSFDFSQPPSYATNTGAMIGLYEWNETEPIYRRIEISRESTWARICYRRRPIKFTSRRDLVPLNSEFALMMMLKAMKSYDLDSDVTNGATFEVHALRFLIEEQEARSPQTFMPPQIMDRGSVASTRWDEDVR
jgi:hypothetical protein